MKPAKTDVATTDVAVGAVAVTQEEPQRGGSFTRNPDTGAVTLNEPAPADQPVKE